MTYPNGLWKSLEDYIRMFGQAARVERELVDGLCADVRDRAAMSAARQYAQIPRGVPIDPVGEFYARLMDTACLGCACIDLPEAGPSIGLMTDNLVLDLLRVRALILRPEG